MARAEQFGRDSLGIAVSRVVVTVSVLGTSLITARWLGPQGRGEYSVAVLLASILVIALDVIGPGAVYFSARATYPRRRVLGSTIVVGSAVGVATVLVCLALSPVRGSLFGDIPGRYLLLAILGIPFGLVIADVAGVLLGAKDFLGFNGAQIAQNVVPLVAVMVALVVFSGGPGAAVGATTLSTVVVAIGVVAWGRRRAGGIDLRPDVGYTRGAARYGIRAQIGTILGYLANRVDVLLVNGYLNAASAGLYSVALGIAERALIVADGAATALFPRIAGDREGVGHSSLTPIVARTVLWMTVVVAGVMFAVSHWVIVVLYSGRFEASVRPLQILLLSMIAAGPARILGADVSARGRPGVASAVAGGALTANVACNLILIPRYGMMGAAWSSVASYTLGALLILAAYLHLSGNSLRSVLVPNRQDAVLLRRIVVGLLRRGRDPGTDQSSPASS